MLLIPAGFMLLQRTAIEKMRKHFAELRLGTDDVVEEKRVYTLFNTEVVDGQLLGEDVIFCRRLTQAGVDIWVDPFIRFDHNGVKGSLVQALHMVKS